jgi:hypothetical protein
MFRTEAESVESARKSEKDAIIVCDRSPLSSGITSFYIRRQTTENLPENSNLCWSQSSNKFDFAHDSEVANDDP